MGSKFLRRKVYQARWRKTVMSVCFIVFGLVIAALCYYWAHISDLERYKYGDPDVWLPDFRSRQLAPLWLECLFILGYSLVLSGFAWIQRCWAASSFGRGMARYVFAAVLITATADLVKDCLLHRIVRCDPHSPSVPRLAIGISTAATIKWCAALLALGGLAALVGITGRGAMALFCRYQAPRIWKDNPAEPRLDYAYWWNDVWVEPKLPTFKDAAAARHVAENETSWFEAYKVPGAVDVIDELEGKPVQAICLSGGGVRSACVAMGATQIFSKEKPINPKEPDPPKPAAPRRLIDNVDYIISVSGGGYTSGARLLATQPKPGDTSTRPLLSERFERGSAEFDHFRRGSSYIADSPVALVGALGVVLRNLIASLLMLFTVPAILGWVFGYLLAVPLFSFAAFVPLRGDFADGIVSKWKCTGSVPPLLPHGDSWWAIVSFALLAFLFTVFAICAEWFRAPSHTEAARVWLLKAAAGSAIFAALVLVVVAGLPGLMWLCSKVNPADAGKVLSGVVGVNYVAVIVTMVAKKRDVLPLNAATKPSGWKKLLPPAVLQLILVLATFVLLGLAWLTVLGSFAVAVFRQAAPYACGGGIPLLPGLGWLVELLVLLVAVLCLSFADVTSLSLHPFYRLRLARTFAVRRVPSKFGDWHAQRYPPTEWTPLPVYGQSPPGGPKFVFATAATLSGEAAPAPGLNAVSYVLSADCVGGPELGWLHTERLCRVAPPRLKRDLTVQASVAVSGAAFASAMGRQNDGYQKLLAISGARLGTWLPNPNLVGKLVSTQKRNCVDEEDYKTPWPTSLPTIRGAGYFYRELLGINKGDARLVQLTDGGHYENLGLVEALRRRCRLIFCIDAGGDTPPLLSTLSDAMRLAKYELGVTIKLNEKSPYSVNDIAPGSGGPFPKDHALARLNGRLTKGTVAYGKIEYPLAAGLTEPQTRHGILIFAKAVLWEGCPEWLLTYAASSEVFPHDPTSDQWFNEGQFAAYTALGRIMGDHAVRCVESLQLKKLI